MHRVLRCAGRVVMDLPIPLVGRNGFPLVVADDHSPQKTKEHTGRSWQPESKPYMPSSQEDKLTQSSLAARKGTDAAQGSTQDFTFRPS